uniref:Uncharacterized protein n=1 Tax=Cannabis sativa TaxID=3483 RepID=A0A803P6J8_CANSA
MSCQRVYADTSFANESWIVPLKKDDEDAQSATVILSQIDDREVTSTQTVLEKDRESTDNMRFMVAMASCSNLKRKILVSKEIEPPVREVVQVIPAASTASKREVKKRSRTTGATLPA